MADVARACVALHVFPFRFHSPTGPVRASKPSLSGTSSQKYREAPSPAAAPFTADGPNFTVLDELMQAVDEDGAPPVPQIDVEDSSNFLASDEVKV